MQDNKITKSILSISSPGVHLVSGDKDFNCKLTRQCNDFANDLVRRKPTEFGFWAALPLPDVESTLAEISHVLSNLQAVGFALETNHHGTYLGDPSFEVVFKELNRVKATVFLHPTTPCFKQVGKDNDNGHTAVTFLPQYPNPLMEFMFDTARALINLFTSGTLHRCPDITFIVPHAGGALPPILQRFSTFATAIMRSEIDLSARSVKETFRRQFYFDLAGFPFPDQIHGLLRIVGPERLLYGSDYPFTPPKLVGNLSESMKAGLEELFSDEGIRERIYSGNARDLLRMGN